MKIWNRIVSGIYTLAGICFAFFFLTAWAVKKDFISAAAEYVETNISMLGFAGAAMVFMGIVWVVNWFDYSYKTKTVSFDNPDGKIKISLRAIENYISSMLVKQIKGIHSLRVKTSVSSKGLNTKISLKLFSQFNIPDLCTHIQEATKNYLQDAVGVERIGNIEIFISSIKSNGQSEEEDIEEDTEAEAREEDRAEDAGEEEKH